MPILMMLKPTILRMKPCLEHLLSNDLQCYFGLRTISFSSFLLVAQKCLRNTEWFFLWFWYVHLNKHTSLLESFYLSKETKTILISKGGSCKEVSRAKVQEPSHGKASHGKASQWAKLYFSIPYFQIQYICISAKAAFLAKDQSLGKINLWDWFGCDLEGVYKCKKIGANLLLRWIPGVFITSGTYHFSD